MIRYNYEPLLVLGPVFVIWLAGGLIGRRCFGNLHAMGSKWLQATGLAVALLLVIANVALVLTYLVSATHLDHIEPSVVCGAYGLMHGKTLYHAPDAAERYSLLYGPATHLLYGIGMWGFGESFFACKLVAGMAALGAFAIGARLGSRFCRGEQLWLLAGALAALLLAHAPKTFWVRADPLILFCVTWALWAAVSARRTTAVACFAIALGIATNLKINAPLHFALPGVLLYERFGPRALIATGIVGGATAMLPFLLPGVSFENWVSTLRVAGRHGIGLAELRWAAEWFVSMGGMLVSLWLVTKKFQPAAFEDGPRLGGKHLLALLVSLVGAGLFASKAGSDPTQFVPLLPLLVWVGGYRWFSLALPTRRLILDQHYWFGALLGASLLTGGALGIYQGQQTFRAILQQDPISSAVYSDLRFLMMLWRDKRISMGCGDNRSEFISNHFVPLALEGHPYLLDPVALMEYDKAGMPLPVRTRELIEKANVDVWLIPKGDAPFSMRNPYPPHRPLFDTAFREAFERRYRKIASSHFFDVYAPE